jgi:hypothetical protein
MPRRYWWEQKMWGIKFFEHFRHFTCYLVESAQLYTLGNTSILLSTGEEME